ncbi:cytochrome P450 [Williamsia sp. CHRR-6]|uniref:cytochrome P450 n=1 Tax=Williamsia sp. CHRR-6 TaxID=2835871 RepID=UPI001BD95C46|nr:cytochrome P450 [Williamsia sp. CHRR-6]MBT0566095.1 cytochrome P450 [Williamsia sp. CHRR-6]
MTKASKYEAIPEPAGLPLVGHTFSVPEGPGNSFEWLSERATELGPIFRMRVADLTVNVLTGLDVVSEVTDDAKFYKLLTGDFAELRPLLQDGLLSAGEWEPNWQKAHEILLPAFSQGAMRIYHDAMSKVLRKLIAKWDQYAADGTTIDVNADTTRLTFDMIGLMGFGYDFQSFDKDELHPFVAAMTRVMAFANLRSRSLPGEELFQRKGLAQFEADIATMNKTVDDVIAERRRTGDTSTNDVLGRMLTTPNPNTGEYLDDANIRAQTITFLLAGHETTSGLIAYALMHLVKHPDSLARAQAEVDSILGDEDHPEVSYNDIGQFTYMRRVIDETLRLTPSVPLYQVAPYEDAVLLGKYLVPKDQPVIVHIAALHRQPEWGGNAHLFDPDRFSPERSAGRSPHLFKPFGNGKRACIGRQFAIHEAMMTLTEVVHRYNLFDVENYQLSHTGTITVHPAGFKLKLERRTSEERRAAPAQVEEKTTSVGTARRATGTALRVLHGSNLGTCSGIAEDLAANAEQGGFEPTVAPLNSAVDTLSDSEGPVLIVAASYNGEPTSDAAEFLSWVEGLQPASLDGVSYSLLGVGDRNWPNTYHAVPKRLEAALDAAGATALTPRGVTDVAGDFVGDVNRWTAETIGVLLEKYGTETTAEAVAAEPDDAPLYTITEASPTVTGKLVSTHSLTPMTVIETRELVDMEHELGRSKRFVRVQLPDGVTYRSGDHLAVLPVNGDDLVTRVAARFSLDPETVIRLTPRRRGSDVLPVDRPLSVRTLLSEVVELQLPATKEAVAALLEHTQCPPDRARLEALSGLSDEEFAAEVTAKNVSVFDLLEPHPAIEIPFVRFLELVPAIKPRSYSISSSAAASPTAADLMVSLVDAPHRKGEGSYRGVASNYLQNVREGDVLQARVLACAEAFRLPTDDSVPVIMVAAGTGVAPFRGGILDRQHAGFTGPALAYFGFDHPDVDYLHRDELEAAEAAGAVSMRPTFLHAPDGDVTFVQHRIAREADEVWSLLSQGGKVYVCGDGRFMAPAVREAFAQIYADRAGTDLEGGRAWLSEQIAAGVFVEDVWA